MKNDKTMKIVLTGLFAALSYVVFTFFQIKITLPGGDATSGKCSLCIGSSCIRRSVRRNRRSPWNDNRRFI